MVNCHSHSKYELNLPFTLEQHLKNYAECDHNARRLFESFHIIREKITVSLRPVISLFPHYSDHSHEHSENVITSIEKLLGRDRIEKLSPADTWMLLVCSYMHDIGMIVQGSERDSDWCSPEFQTHIKNCLESTDDDLRKAAQHVSSLSSLENITNWPVQIYRDVILISSEYYRSKHPERAKELPLRSELQQSLNCVLNSDGRLPSRIQGVIGKICHSHGLSFENMLQSLEAVDGLLGYTFHPRFVAALLRLGDLCDLDNGRFNSLAIEMFGKLTKSNRIHYYKHDSVSSFVIQKDSISVIFDIPNQRIKQELKSLEEFDEEKKPGVLQDFCDLILLEAQNWLGWIAETVELIKIHWNEFNISDIDALSPTLTYNVLVDSRETVFSNKNLKFSFSNEKAYELVEGYNLYNSQFVFIRELLQNGMDALKKQFWNDILSGRWNHLLKHLEKDGKIDYHKIQPYDFSDTSIFNFYQVNIHVDHKEGEKFAKFTIEDNGTGISKSDVQNRIIKSGYRNNSEDKFFNEMPEWLKPTSAFGIGLHSVFAVTDKIFVQTCNEKDGEVYNINMHSSRLDGYIFMSRSDNQGKRFCNSSHGTNMSFSVDVEKCMENHLLYEDMDDDDNLSKSPLPESKFCSLIQKMLKNIVKHPLFTVSYQFNQDDVVTCDNLCSDRFARLLFDSKRRNHIFGIDKSNGCERYAFAFGLLSDIIVLWDKKYAILEILRLGNDIHTECTVSYKGFFVEMAEIIQSPFLQMETVCYLGGTSHDIVNVSRDKLSAKQQELNNELFKDARSQATNIYYDIFKTLLDDGNVKSWNSNIVNFVDRWSKINSDNSEIGITDELFDNFNYDVSICNNTDLKHIILVQGFCRLMKNERESIKKILLSFSDMESLKSHFSSSLLDINSISNILGEQNPVVRYINQSINYLLTVNNAEFVRNDKKNAQRYLLYIFVNLFREEFTYVVFDDFPSPIYSPYSLRYKGSFGELSVFPYEYSVAFSRVKNKYYRKYIVGSEDEGKILSPLDVYLSLPVTSQVYLFLSSGKDIEFLHEKVNSLLSCLPGYDNTYGFIGVKNVGDIVFSPRIKIKNTSYNRYLRRYFPLLQSMSYVEIYLENDDDLILELERSENQWMFLNYKCNSFERLLSSGRNLKIIPVSREYEDIAIEDSSICEINSKEEMYRIFFYRNYMTLLWDTSRKIISNYQNRLFSDKNKKNDGKLTLREEKEKILNELMPESGNYGNNITNVLRIICQQRAFNHDLSYDDAWKKICTTYRKFILHVLDNIPRPKSGNESQDS